MWCPPTPYADCVVLHSHFLLLLFVYTNSCLAAMLPACNFKPLHCGIPAFTQDICSVEQHKQLAVHYLHIMIQITAYLTYTNIGWIAAYIAA